MAKVFTITAGLENMGALKSGGQGSIYKARRTGEIITAIKLLPTPIYSESAADKNFISFQNEVRKLKKVNESPNPNVVKILSSGITDSGNFPYIEMEFIEGPDLEDLLKPPHPPIFTIKEVLKVADHLSNALAHCHKADVRHGDIKSNNVKFNTHTGNYILLDFGLSVMSDEERRTSLRHAGAIEFMAPEQNEGKMFSQTDIYSFGIILYELLAGTVPFPLKDNGETSRNNVMLSHMDATPPDLLTLRQQKLPSDWNQQKKEQEMLVPDWLVSMIYKCLEKNPEQRFTTGIELHEYIWQNSIKTYSNSGINAVNTAGGTEDQLKALLQENKRLFREKEQLQQQLLKYQGKSNTSLNTVSGEAQQSYTFAPPRSNLNRNILLIVFIILAASAAGYFVWKQTDKTPEQAIVKKTEPSIPPRKNIIGEYRVTAQRAYFYNEPDEATKRNAWAIPSDEVIKATDERNDFIYTQIVNQQGQVSKGWLRKQDLMTLEDWKRKEQAENNEQTTGNEISAQLESARQFLSHDQLPEALDAYGKLSEREVPEAMYEYSNLALHNKNENLNCTQAFELLVKASNAGYTPAKRTLGFLYCFADNDDILKASNYYERCTFTKNMSKGSQLLIQAMLRGDTTAARLLDDLNIKR